MIFSMTGFGKSSGAVNGHFFEIEIKSVNSRFLELSVRLPNTLQTKEFEIRDFLREKIKRGKVSVFISQKNEVGKFDVSKVDTARFKDVIDLLNGLRSEFKISEEVSLTHLTAFRELFVEESEGISDEGFEGFKQILAASVENLSQMRAKEGEHLKEDLLERIAIIDQSLKRITDIFRSTLHEHFEKQKARAKELVADATSFTERLELELALLTDKADITEESTRLKSHLKVFNTALVSGGEIGRKLNFLCQEMHRETNTISSKSVSAEIIHETLTIKEEIEKIKEQVQNIE